MPTTKYKNRIHLPQDSVKGFFVALEDAHRLFGNDKKFSNNNMSKKIGPEHKPKNPKGQNIKRFGMSQFGICNHIGLGIQSNGAGKLFLRSEEEAIIVSKYDNPLRDPLDVIYCKKLKRYFLKNGFHRLFECARRRYKGWVLVNVLEGDVHECPVGTLFPCIAEKKIQYNEEVL